MSINAQIATLLNNGLETIANRLANAVDVRSEVEDILANSDLDYGTPLVDAFGHTTNLVRVLNVVKRKAVNGPCMQTILMAA